ncbi:hypothetical protein DDB_G0291950 [Dictyostelium discoideum AX4]|uniref:hypothetical protein n=1 Tax=Dictyostelium discoideum AX4 TaxID=352472 RepID=UPI00004E39AD|nr:hypothetical protein DDB_G0291950 [Dictyostelium discoideum AX4]EAL61505.1 hypothetical protein DDB_G0291950 [Dictyostelium discoideum AX4]|eukprot:XP_629922.1 hypothetical protein DDB_G0291950 [Dictyostelium discoideum AX4]
MINIKIINLTSKHNQLPSFDNKINARRKKKNKCPRLANILNLIQIEKRVKFKNLKENNKNNPFQAFVNQIQILTCYSQFFFFSTMIISESIQSSQINNILF